VIREKIRETQGKELFDILIGCLDKELTEAKITTVLWSVDDVLRYIPMAALYDGHGYLVERFSSATYTKVSSRADESRKNWKALAAGVSLGSEADRLKPLASVPAELTAVVHVEDDPKSQGVLPGRILLDPAFSRDAFRAGLHQGYPVVHVASHFVFNPISDVQSFLLLGDGKLSLAEIRTNDEYTFLGVDLLALSACDTAAGPKGNGQEIDGLGFLADEKGAHAVLATLWSVDDKSTASLMTHFYSELESDPGVSKAEALRRAQLALLDSTPSVNGVSGNFNRPFFWAPFILLGNAN
jgi:CHAT domain-containing protein